MKTLKLVTFAATALMAVATTPSIASSDSVRCHGSSQSQWRSMADVRSAAQALGYRNVRKVEVEKGCYEAYAFDRKNRRVEIYMHPVTLKIVRVKVKH